MMHIAMSVAVTQEFAEGIEAGATAKTAASTAPNHALMAINNAALQAGYAAAGGADGREIAKTVIVSAGHSLFCYRWPGSSEK